MNSIKCKIKRRLKAFIELDVDGLRSHILSVFLQVKKTTVDEIHQKINSKFEISRSAVASMVGYIYSKLGILRSFKESYKKPTVYSLKEEYVDLLRFELESKNKSMDCT